MKQPYPQVNGFSATSASTTCNTVPQGPSPVDPFSPEQRFEILRRFMGGNDIPRLATDFGTGYKIIQIALRAQLRAVLAGIR